MAMKPAQIKLDDALLEDIDFIVKQKGRNRSHWLREFARTGAEAKKAQILAERDQILTQQLAEQKLRPNTRLEA